MLYLRIIALAAWGAVLAWRARSIWQVLRGRGRHYDILFAIIANFGLLVAGFQIRAIWAPDSVSVQIGLHCYSILLASFALWAMWSYQRSGRG